MRNAARTKERIDETALRLFVENGVTETTVRHIAAVAGIAEGTLYRHYTSKDQLALDLFEGGFTSFASTLERLRREHPTAKAQIEAMIRHFCAFFDRDPVLFSYLLLSQHIQVKKLMPGGPHPLHALRDAIAEGIERGEIPKMDPVVAASMVLGLVVQVAVSKVYGRFEEGLSSHADTLVAAAWRVLEV
jgi:AcrR family transcriptional regulator